LIQSFRPYYGPEGDSLYQKCVPGIFRGGKVGRYVELTTLPPSYADCLGI